jgi:hypothetical protein
MAKRENTILSFSRDPVSLAERQRHLQAASFEVISVGSEAEARLRNRNGTMRNPVDLYNWSRPNEVVSAKLLEVTGCFKRSDG